MTSGYNIRFERWQKARLEAAAEARGVSQAEVIRDAVVEATRGVSSDATDRLAAVEEELSDLEADIERTEERLARLRERREELDDERRQLQSAIEEAERLDAVELDDEGDTAEPGAETTGGTESDDSRTAGEESAATGERPPSDPASTDGEYVEALDGVLAEAAREATVLHRRHDAVRRVADRAGREPGTVLSDLRERVRSTYTPPRDTSPVSDRDRFDADDVLERLIGPRPETYESPTVGERDSGEARRAMERLQDAVVEMGLVDPGDCRSPDP
jgi:hypothetical protein